MVLRLRQEKSRTARLSGAGKGCYVKSRGLADTEKVMPAGLMPAAIRPILKLSFTKDVLRSRQLSVFRLPDGSHFFRLLMPVNECGAALVLPRLIDASFSAGAGGFAVNMNIFLLFSPLKMAGFFYA